MPPTPPISDSPTPPYQPAARNRPGFLTRSWKFITLVIFVGIAVAGFYYFSGSAQSYYYEMCTADAGSSNPVIVKITSDVNKIAPFPPKGLEYKGDYYSLKSNISSSDQEKAIAISNNWIATEGCPNTGGTTGSSNTTNVGSNLNTATGTDCMSHIVMIKDDGLLVDGKKVDTCEAGTCRNPSAFGKHIAYIKRDFTSGDSYIMYDGKKYFDTKGPIPYLKLYKDHIIFVASNADYNNPRQVIYFDGKELGAFESNSSYDLGYGYGIFGDHLAYPIDNNKHIVVDGNPIQDTLTAFANGNFVIGLGNQFKYSTGDRYSNSNSNLQKWFLNEKSVNWQPYFSSTTLLYLLDWDSTDFSSSLVIADKQSVLGDGYVVLNGKEVTLPSLADMRIKHAQEMNSRCMTVSSRPDNKRFCEQGYPDNDPAYKNDQLKHYFNGDVAISGAFDLYANDFAFVTHADGLVADITTGLTGSWFSGYKSADSSKSGDAIYHNGAIVYPVNGSIIDLKLFGATLAYVVRPASDSLLQLFVNGTKVSESKEINTLTLFDGHWAYTNENGEVIYDGNNLGKGKTVGIFNGSIVLYGDHIFYEEQISSNQYFDGKIVDSSSRLGQFGEVGDSSVGDNMRACRLNYLENL